MKKWKDVFFICLTVAVFEFALSSSIYVTGNMNMITYVMGMMWAWAGLFFLYKWQTTTA
jgi:hypothetical protein